SPNAAASTSVSAGKVLVTAISSTSLRARPAARQAAAMDSSSLARLSASWLKCLLERASGAKAPILYCARFRGLKASAPSGLLQRYLLLQHPTRYVDNRSSHLLQHLHDLCLVWSFEV